MSSKPKQKKNQQHQKSPAIDFLPQFLYWLDELEELQFTMAEEKVKTELIAIFLFQIFCLKIFQSLSLVPADYLTRTKTKTLTNANFSIEKRIHSFLSELQIFFDSRFNISVFNNFNQKFFVYLKKDHSNLIFFQKKIDTLIDESIHAFKWIKRNNCHEIADDTLLWADDIFGKIYELYLVQQRRERGIFYTPTPIIKYIVESTVTKVFDEKLQLIKQALLEKNRKKCEHLVSAWCELRILDPACGTGSFLVHAFKTIWKNYQKLESFLHDAKKALTPKQHENIQFITQLEEKLGYHDKKTLFSKIILRHLFGVDLDKKALEIAELNIWFYITLLNAKKEVQPYDFPLIVPILEINLIHGDSLVDPLSEISPSLYLPDWSHDFKTLSHLRKNVLTQPNNLILLEKVQKIKNKLRNRATTILNKHFITKKNLLVDFSVTTPLYWIIEFWFAYFHNDSLSQSDMFTGFDIIIGNPPWVSLSGPRAKTRTYKKLVEKYLVKNYVSALDQMRNIFALFLEKGIQLLKPHGLLGYLLPDILLHKNFPHTRKYLLDHATILEIVNCGMIFPHANIDTIILLLEKPKNGDTYQKKHHILIKSCNNFEITTMTAISQKTFYLQPKFKFNIALADEKICRFKQKMEENSILLGEIVECHEGIHSGNVRKKLFLNEKINDKCKPLIFGRQEISRYLLKWQGKYVYYDPTIIKRKNGEYAGLGKPHYFEREKLIVRRTGDHIVAAYDNNNFYVSNNAFVLFNKENSPVPINLKVLLAILNSSLMTAYYRIIQPRKGKLFAELKLEHLRSLPIPKNITKFAEIKELEQLVDSLINQKRIMDKYEEFWAHTLQTHQPQHCRISLKALYTTKKRVLHPWQQNVPDITVHEIPSKIEPKKTNTLVYLIESHNDVQLQVHKVAINSDNAATKKSLILTITTSTHQLHDILFLRLYMLIKSRKKIKTLDQLLQKTIIDSHDIDLYHQTNKKLHSWLKEHDEEQIMRHFCPARVAVNIKEIEDKIEQIIAKLYDLKAYRFFME